ncbi:TIGR01459 family HAD-type hydrolase [Falsihalocynthiibacter arcticus]|uniref:HAD family hydrolase n=1 Tax=Falsihalocynthiibacter arcticus TaxID=1579316 RepID=A0A126UVI0_9RHOB|nr:TIGR01459 family HAD-type hydrolase [Falsihalocynthiibacter arcticus]AML50072.1 HAD family hydrolase [Falsihalocynthiibacter arcticus]
MSRIVSSLAEISDTYDALFVDLWGCVHDGIAAIPDAVAALQAYRKRGGKVILVTNSPRPRASVEIQLDGFGVPRDAWDAIATSGDSARSAMFRGAVGEKVYFMGTEDEKAAFFRPIAVVKDAREITAVPLAEAEGIVCCGPKDSLADPAVNRPTFLAAKTRGLKLLCANPDIVVDRGERREWCAGALAALYTEMGGDSMYFGKPHPPIYDLARRRLAEIDSGIPDDRILAIGDGIHTDIQGAVGEDIDSLFITGGLAAAETGTTDQPNPKRLKTYLDVSGFQPTYSIGFLR